METSPACRMISRALVSSTTPSFNPEGAAAARAAGKEVWWYICCGPHHPHANMFVEYPAIEARLHGGSLPVEAGGEIVLFEIEKLSSKFNDTYVEVAPFKLGGPIASTITTFTFKVEVFKVADNEALEQMYYTPDGSTPLNNGTNDVDASQSWSWDATAIEGANEYACKISYLYFVNFVA